MGNFPKHHKAEILRLVEEEKLNPTQIALKLNLKRASVETMLRKLGYTFTLIQTPQFFKKEILSFLQERKRPFEIAKILNLNYISTQQMCQKLGFKASLDQGDIRYFQTLDSNLKAYFLGFICADGAIVKNTLTITIHRKDKEILEKLKLEIGCEHRIKSINTPMGFDKTRNVDHVRFEITNSLLIQDLNSYGIYPRKSMTIGNILENIPLVYRDSFIVGYFDGDGSVQLPRGSSKFVAKENKIVSYPSYALTVSFRGTKPFLRGISDHLQLNSNIVFHKTYILNIGNKRDVLKFFNCYKNLTFFLKRKHDRFLERINHESYKKIMQD
jgi:hypothetical protein